MHGIQRFFRRVWSDMLARRYIETYVVAFFALVFAVATLFDNALSADFQMAVILAALGLLVLNITTPERGSGDLDSYLNDRSDFKPFEELVRDARELWIYAPSAANILSEDNLKAIRTHILSHPNGVLRVIIQDPDEREAVKILIEQLDESLTYQTQYLETEITRTLNQFLLIQKWPVAGTFDYRLLHYSPGFSLVAVDPNKNNGLIIVELHGFSNDTTGSRMHIKIRKAESERWFVYWREQYEAMWERGRQPADASDETP